MPQGEFGYFVKVSAVDPGFGNRLPVDPGYGHPEGPPHISGGPIIPPPLPGVWPPPGTIAPPIYIPPAGIATPPIYIPESPEHPIQLPPNTIWPPLPPDVGLEGKVAILILVVGVGYRWFIYDSAQVTHPIAPTPSPKRGV